MKGVEMREQLMELACSGYLLPNAEASANLTLQGESDFEIVWNAAIRGFRESNSYFVRLGEEPYGVQVEPPNSHDPEVIKLEYASDNRSGRYYHLLTLQKSGQAILYMSGSSIEYTTFDPTEYSGFADYYESPHENTWPEGHPKTVNYLHNLANDITSKENYREQRYTEHKDSTKYDEPVSYEQKAAQTEPQEVEKLAQMLENMQNIDPADTTAITAILNEEFEKFDAKHNPQNNYAGMQNKMFLLLKRTLARLHPDTGHGDAELFKIVNNLRDKLKRDISS